MYSPTESATWYSSLPTREPPIFKPIGSPPRAGGKVGEFVFELVRSGLGHQQPWRNLGTCQPRRTTHFILFMCVVCVSFTGVMTLVDVSIMLEVIAAFELRFGDGTYLC